LIVDRAWGGAAGIEDGTNRILESEIMAEAVEDGSTVYTSIINMIIPVDNKWDFPRIRILYYGAGKIQGSALRRC